MKIENINVYLVGTAGSGKTSLAYAFQCWMDEQKFRSAVVNLDPGAERLPYAPDVDVRDWIELSDVMNRFSVGPNGAQIICADMLALKALEIKEAIDTLRVDYVIIDTPGQIELFAMRESSKVLVNTLGSHNLLAFLFDPILSRTPSGFISLYLLCASVLFRFNLPSASFLSKVDVLKHEDVEKIVEWSQNSDSLYDALNVSKVKQTDLEIFKALEGLGSFGVLTPISSETRYGLEDLYNIIQQIYSGGEDLSLD
jgi:hypothetical protein